MHLHHRTPMTPEMCLSPFYKAEAKNYTTTTKKVRERWRNCSGAGWSDGNWCTYRRGRRGNGIPNGREEHGPSTTSSLRLPFRQFFHQAWRLRRCACDKSNWWQRCSGKNNPGNSNQGWEKGMFFFVLFVFFSSTKKKNMFILNPTLTATNGGNGRNTHPFKNCPQVL